MSYQTSSRRYASSSTSIGGNSAVEASNRQIKVVSWLEKLLEPVWEYRFEMGRYATLKSDATNSSAPDSLLEQMDSLGDKICLLIPYADCKLRCSFSFCWMDLMIPPEVTAVDQVIQNYEQVGDNDFLRHFERDVSPEFDWNPINDANCLLEFIKIFLSAYGKYQCEQAGVYQAIKREMGCSMQRNSKFQLYLRDTEPGKNSSRVAVFTIFSHCKEMKEIPGVSDNDREFVVTVMMDPWKTKMRLYMNPFLDRMLQDEPISLPQDVKGVYNCARLAEDLVNARVSLALEAIDLNEKLTQHVRAMFPVCQIIDFTAQTYQKVALMVKGNAYVCILKIEFPLLYPRHEVKVSASSVYSDSLINNRSVSVSFRAHHIRLDVVSRDLENKVKETIKTLRDAEKKLGCR